VPARRNQEKTHATETPLAAIAPVMPTRSTPRDDAETMPAEDFVLQKAPVVANSTGSLETVNSETADVGETLPEDAVLAPARRSGRKIAPKRSGAGVPRTIAELQRQESGFPADDAPTGITTEANIDTPPFEGENAIPQVVEEEVLLLVPLRTVAITTAVMWLLAAFIPQVVLVAFERIGVNSTTSSLAYYITLGVGGILTFLLLVRAWQGAYGPHMDDLSWRTIPEIWVRRSKTYPGGLARRDTWTTAALAALGGFVFLAGLLLFTVVRGLPATLPVLPVLLLIVPVKALVGAVFVGFLQRGLTAQMPRSRAALITGIIYGLAIAAQNAVAFAAPTRVTDGQTVAVSQVIIATAIAVTVSFFVGIGIAWFRLRTRSVWAAVAFQLTLLLLQFPV